MPVCFWLNFSCFHFGESFLAHAYWNRTIQCGETFCGICLLYWDCTLCALYGPYNVRGDTPSGCPKSAERLFFRFLTIVKKSFLFEVYFFKITVLSQILISPCCPRRWWRQPASSPPWTAFCLCRRAIHRFISSSRSPRKFCSNSTPWPESRKYVNH